jgi:NADH-quinone oxidoreductase subunit J
MFYTFFTNLSFFTVFNFLILVLLILSSILVVFVKNPIHSILFLVVVFFNATTLLLLYDIEFLALIFLIVYVGAISVLFLFVIMMLNIRVIELSEDFLKYLPILGLISLIFIFQTFGFYDFFYSDLNLSDSKIFRFKDWSLDASFLSQTQILGKILYVDYVSLFWLAGFILLISMLGAIVLTFSYNSALKKQQIYKQMSRDYNKSIHLY